MLCAYLLHVMYIYLSFRLICFVSLTWFYLFTDCGELPDRAVYDLVCVEVTLDLSTLFAIPYVDPQILKNHPPPRSEKEKKKLIAMKAAAKEQLNKVPKSIPSPHFHQLVGVYPSSSERAPSSVDTGLFEWEYFRDYRGPPAPSTTEKEDVDIDDGTLASASVASAGTLGSTGKIKSSSSGISVLPPIGSPGGSSSQLPLNPGANTTASNSIPEPPTKTGWDMAHPVTGVQTYYCAPTGNVTKSYQMKIIGKEPAPEYFSQNMPRKIRLWLGI